MADLFYVKSKVARQFALCAAVGVAMVACGRSVDSPLVPLGTPSAVDIVGQPTGPAGTSNLSLKDQIAQLEQSGQVVPLDRSDSLLGADLDNNGVRDDIDAYIKSLNLTSAQARAALQKAKALQMTLGVDVTDKTAVQKVGDIQMAGANCFVNVFAGSPAERQISQALESKTANTKIRVTKYLAYNSASSGSVTTLPSADTCEK